MKVWGLRIPPNALWLGKHPYNLLHPDELGIPQSERTPSPSSIADVSKPFVVETDTSDFATGGVLTHKGHSIAYESRKLNSVERSQPDLTSKQARWQEFLAKIDFKFEHKKGTTDKAAYIRSHKGRHALLYASPHPYE
ncbi:reverse transcriptase [Cucumis melo var. makuwa]|uniref:Reverse transcriptase n=1 Tax=Cucumis melo var. makuwa TaxID=1194695 RepID=A0A5D3BRY7_CUCMM|nr:reverse transcriptase [Cucumis melo var. makuwa]